MVSLPRSCVVSPEVRSGLEQGAALVALESTVITHGLPYSENKQLALDMEATVRDNGAVPVTIAVLDGKVRLGLSEEQLTRLATEDDMLKISARDLGIVIAQGKSGGTTVAATLRIAHLAGIRVFATGGIGGVHQAAPFDISADLPQLVNTAMIVVCAGAKAILDIPATLEYLETTGVPVVGYHTDNFPAFFSQDSGLRLDRRVESPGEVIAIAQAHWELGAKSAVLVTVPTPDSDALPYESVQAAVQKALTEAEKMGLRGQGVTPFLLDRVSELTGGASLQANLALLRNNARLAAEIARQLPMPSQSFIA